MGRLWCIFLLFLLAGCDSGEPGKLSTGEFEGDEGEAVARYIIAHVPELDPKVPKIYCVVKGPRLISTKMDFTRRMNDLKLKFVSGEVLTVQEPNKSIVDPATGVSPITIQLLEMKRTGATTTEVVAGWAYKKTWERHRYKVTTSPERKVEDLGRIEGNYEKPVQ